MKSNHFSSVHKFFVLIGIIAIAFVGYGIKSFWFDGPHNIENVARTYETAVKFNRLKDYNHVKRIGTLGGQDRAREAIKVADEFGEQIKSLNLDVDSQSYDLLYSSLVKNKKSLVGMISNPELKKIITVLKRKVTLFKGFVQTNSWKRLTRNTQRLETTLLHHPSKSPGYYTYTRIRGLKNSLTKNVNFMEKITQGSVLKELDKNSILIKLKGLRTEIQMLERYNKNFSVFTKTKKNLERSYKKWASEIGPLITNKRISLESGSQKALYGLLGFITFLVFSILGSFYFLRRDTKNIELEREKLTIDILKNNILPVDVSPIEEGSPEFQREIDKYREYIHKRMSFGAVFQDAMPFSSMLLDSNLNMVWANANFYESWKLESKKDDSINWDFLQRFTNLGENDPILEAIKHDLAGIYQVQVKPENTKEACPFEMYVSPVEYAGQKRLMVIFYPLRGVEDTISHLTKSLVGPVSRSLEALTIDQFDNDFQERIATDFEVAGIESLFEQFQKFNELITAQRSSSLSEINNLEDQVSDHLQAINDVSELAKYKGGLQKLVRDNFKVFKETIIRSVDMRAQTESLFRENIKATKELYREQDALIVSSSRIQSVLGDNEKAFETVMANKDNLKRLKGLVEDYRTRMIRTIEQTLIFKKGMDPQMETILDKIKFEVRGFDQTLKEFSQVVTGMDVCLSKVGLILERTETPDLTETRKRFDNYRNYIETSMHDAQTIGQESEIVDETMVSSLKNLFDSLGKEESILREMEYLVTPALEEARPTTELS